MNILLAVSGSIAAYKSMDLLRSLVKRQHKVRIVLTQGALEFVKPELYRYLGAEYVYLPTDDFNSPTPGVPHVELGKWADVLAIAPLSANTLSKLASGQCGDFLGSLFLAWRQNRPVLMFPAMNTMMWQHDFTQEHVAKLHTLPFVRVVDPAAGLLACGDEGAGKLMEVEALTDIIGILNPLKIWDHHVLVTTGATVAPLDPVRYMTNPSSGRTGIEIASAYLAAGAKVTLLVGHPAPPELVALRAHPRCQVISTPTTKDMLAAALKATPHAQTIIAAAAVADFEFNASQDKLKKDQLQNLPVIKAVDVLAELLKARSARQKFVSFAAETDTSEEIFREKFARKPVDLMIGNRVNSGLESGPRLGFAENAGTYWFIDKDKTSPPRSLTKAQLAQQLVEWDKA
jgi:phosphopantothenoylcysteine decarboxylase/phosphopantothenate--cysteine ligase